MPEPVNDAPKPGQDAPEPAPLRQTAFQALLASRAQLLQELTKAAQVGPATHLAASLVLDECKAGLDADIEDIEETLNNAGDLGNNLQLQNLMQRHQQTLAMLSNISKMLSDTALAVIGNSKG